MIEPKIPVNEENRLKDLESYKILDSLYEEDYDNLTAIAAQICGTKISLVSLVDHDRQWFKSKQGFTNSETDRKISFCGHAIHSNENVFVIPDARRDERFYDNPLVTNEPYVTFYAGVPLQSENGYNIGTLCVMDDKPKELNEFQLKSLRALGKQVMNLIELRRKKNQLEQALDRLGKRNKEIEQFTYVAAHDLNSPLMSISSFIEILEEDNKDNFNQQSLEYLKYIKQSSTALRGYIEGIFKFYQSDDFIEKNVPEQVNLEELMNEIQIILNPEQKVEFNFYSELDTLQINKSALFQILLNLITNSIKYNAKPDPSIEISVVGTDKFYRFFVKDNGNGIPKNSLNKIFDLFFVGTSGDKNGIKGNGIGLATVHKIVTSLGGKIAVQSAEGIGSTFSFTLAKMS